MRLTGKRAFITAAGQGIGRATALAYMREGAQVVASDINGELLEGLECETLALDVTNDSALSDAIRTAQPDILFNCAGFVHAGTILEASEEDWNFGNSLNVRAMFKAMQAVLPGMIERGRGSIINMSSVASSVTGVPGRFVYSTTKAAVVGMTKSVATDFITTGVRCNCICPGTVDSPSLHERLRATGDYEAAMAAFVARQPMGRLGSAEEIAALAVYLGSDESAYTTGHEHIIDGGWAI